MGARRLFAAAIVGLGLLVFAGSAQACSCAPMAPGEAMRRADAAIAGELVEVNTRGRLRAVYRYRVQRVYKGAAGIEVGRVLSVRSARDSAACGLPDRVGRRYGLFLFRSGGGWTSGACSMMRRTDCAS